MLFVQVIEIRASYNSFLCCLLLLTQLQNTQRRPKWCATFFKGEEDFILVAMSRKIKGSLHLLRLLYNEVGSMDALLSPHILYFATCFFSCTFIQFSPVRLHTSHCCSCCALSFVHPLVMFLTRRGCFCFSPYILFPLLLGESDDTAVQAIVLFLTGISQSDSPIHSKHASHSLTDSSHCSLCTLLSFPQLTIKLKWDFFAQAVSFNKLLLLKSNLKPFLKDTGIPKICGCTYVFDPNLL